jgi:predicted membrane protein
MVMGGSNQATSKQPMEVVDQSGPWPFITRRVYRVPGKLTEVWSSRHHRKGLLLRLETEEKRTWSILASCLWMPRRLNWWIGIIFAIGSLLFAAASGLSLAPALAQAWSLDSTQINAIFFVGSIPFAVAAYLQLFQTVNAGKFEPGSAPSPARVTLFGWRPHDIGWLSCALQLVGTILFNFNTFDAMVPGLNWFQQEVLIWAPNIIGSILFLASGYLAFIETCHTYWAWKPHSISWWVVFTNLLGCVGFLISALLAFVLPGTPNIEAIHLSVLFTLLGAIGFLVGSLLMLPEMVASGE